MADLDALLPPEAERREPPSAEESDTETTLLNIGPQHPSTHGVLRLVVRLEGEQIVSLQPDVGFLHTGIEKTFEAKTYLQGLTLAPRMSYVAPIHNELAYVLTVEKLLGIDVPERAQVVRVLLAELDRLASHLVFVGSHALDLGATSPMLYTFRERDAILDLFEMVGGARMFPHYIRPGGLASDLPPGFEEAVSDVLDRIPGALDEYEALLTENPLWIGRLRGVAPLTAHQALALGVTGPALRACGVAWDLRSAMPYSGYERYDFIVPIAQEGDAYARYRVRVAEMRESVRIARQALERLPSGPFVSDDRKVVPPPKCELAESMEAVIHHFKLWTEGFRPPPGEAYVAVESPRGEMGFYIVSDGTGRPWRVHMRAPSFANVQALDLMTRGGLVADLVTAIASIDPIMGEVDR